MALVENMRVKVNGDAHGIDLDLGFLAAANAAGLIIDRLKADGKIHRCPTATHPKRKNGAYKLSPAEGGGWLHDWANGGKPQAWFIEAAGNLTEGEKLELKRKQAKARKEAEDARKAAQAAAAEKAQKRWDAARAADGHKYLDDKGIAAHGARIDGATLLIPVRAADGRMMSLQRIFPDGSKFFEQDGAISGGMFVLGEIDPEGDFLIGEGYSTMATCHEATDLPAVVAFNSSNVPKVAKTLRALYPRARICVCADNDHETRDAAGKLTNPGLRDATTAARLAGAALAVPTVGLGKSDFNDMAAELGIDEVENAISDALGTAKEAPVSEPAENIVIPINGKSAPRAKASKSPLGDADAGGILTQDSVALAFTERFKGKLRYCHTSGEWFCWTETHWARDEKRTAFNWARNVTREMTIGKYPGDVKDFRKAGFCSGVERFAQSDPDLAVTSEVWDADTFLLGTPGGTVDLKTGMLRASVPSEGITRITAVAPADTADCPTWLKFLDEATGKDDGMIRFLKQWMGYSLTGDIREQALVFMHGGGGNGKGVFLRVANGILSDYAVTAAMDTFTASKSDKHSTDLAMLRGARMASASETEEGKAWAEARLKNLTGGDQITARFMHQDNFTYLPQFKLFIIGNHKPILKNIGEAERRRFNLVPFIIKPTEKDALLDAKLQSEWPGILRWMIDGCLDWLQNGLLRPESVVKDTKAYFDEQDVFGQWLQHMTDDQNSPDGIKAGYSVQKPWETSSSVLFMSWKDYAISGGEEPGSQKIFSTKLQQRDFPLKRTNKGSFFLGIRLSPQDKK